MESAANLHHHQHQLQDHQFLSSSSSSSSSSSALPIIPSCFGLASSHDWTPNLSLNNNNNSYNYNNPRIFNGVTSVPNRSSDDCGQKNTNSTILTTSASTTPHLNSSIMLQDFGFQWNNAALNSGTFFHDPHSEKIKQEISSSPNSHNQSFPKFTEMLIHNNNNHSSSSDLNDLSHKLLIKTLISSDGCHQINGGDDDDDEFYNTSSRSSNRGHFAQIYPSINVSNWNNLPSPPPPSFSNSLDLNLQTPADMLASAGNFSHSQDNFGIFKETMSDFHDQIQSSPASLPCIPSKMTTFNGEVTESKRPCNSMEQRVNQQSPPLKKSRLDSRASCPPFKVRKEKLGDRIAALQQLVAPFGKTDTASVLMEAIGYIKFLQNQVETLSVPYMKPSSNKTTKPTHRSSVEDGIEGHLNRDLRSRGLCLVPLGCLSYVTGDGGGGGGIWPPPGFNGGTS